MTTKTREVAEQLAKNAPWPVSPEALDLAETSERKAAIRENTQWSAEHKAALLQAEDDRVRGEIHRHKDASVAAATKALDQREGQIRAMLRDDVPGVAEYESQAVKLAHHTAQRLAAAERRAIAQDRIGAIRTSDDPAEIEELAADVALTGPDSMTGRAWREALIRVEALHRRASEQDRPAFVAAVSRVREADVAHRKAHPGPSRALKQIAEQRQATTQAIERFYVDHFSRALGVHDKAKSDREDALVAGATLQRHD